tara:strand:- start:253 stop:1788 length:1536 start_codon:yes stop_codon:yes gene_type:complete
MAYLGIRPTAGENNSFRILDTLSTFTATFDGSSSSIVSIAADTISLPEHRFITGQRVTYNDGGGTAITGLADGVYYVIRVDRNLVQLASSLSNANNGTQINLTGLGAGSSHTLNVAFDGTNTKFKITHDSGTHAKVTRASQVVLSINGVLQQPHDSTSPSTGFGIDADSVLVFSTAPASTDTVFGSIMASNVSSFEISDNAIDNFTGDNSTVNFTLSKTPPDPRNILVTLDGVVQYPSDSGTTRAYTVATNSNVLSFVSAPATGVAIQVRHIGFAGGVGGSSENLVTSVFGRTGDVVLTNSDDVAIRNLTGVGATFTGSVSIGGTLTYEDVKNVDSLGIVTARTGIKVPAGEVTVGNNIQLGNAGVATATLFSGPSQIGIQSAGTQIGAGITQLNFIGAGNTFAVSGTTVAISIAGGSSGAGGTFASNAVGVHTTKILGINTTTIAGSATSEGAIQVRGNLSIDEGLLTLDSNIHTSVSVPSGKNALLIGPTTVAVGATIDVAQGSTLVVV